MDPVLSASNDELSRDKLLVALKSEDVLWLGVVGAEIVSVRTGDDIGMHGVIDLSACEVLHYQGQLGGLHRLIYEAILVLPQKAC